MMSDQEFFDEAIIRVAAGFVVTTEDEPAPSPNSVAIYASEVAMKLLRKRAEFGTSNTRRYS